MYFANIQAARGLAALLVVVGHLFLFGNAKYGLNVPELTWWGRTFGFGVDIFFVISGFIMMATTQGRQGSAAAGRFMLRRVTRIYPVYWFNLLLLLPVFFLKPGWINSGSDAPTSLLHSFLLLPHNGAPLIMVAWTLEYEMFFYCIFALAMLLFKRQHLLGVLTAWALGSVALGLVAQPQSAFGALATNPLLLEFLLGCWLFKLAPKAKFSWPLMAVLAAAASGIIFAEFLTEALDRTARFALPAATFVLLALVLEQHKKCAAPQWLQSLGDMSYALYLIHMPVLSAMGRLWLAAGLNQHLSPWLLLAAMFVASLCAGAIVYYVVEKPIIRLSRKLLEKELHIKLRRKNP